MYPGNQPATDGNPSTPPLAPPPVAPPAGAWPPRPTIEGEAGAAQPAWFQFNEEYRRVKKSNVSDFRTGWVGMNENGVYITGKQAPRAEIQTPILIVCVILSWVIAVIARVIMEYACRTDAALQLRWDQIMQVVVASNKQRVCLVFSAPNYAGKIKTFSLAFRLPQQDAFNSFVDNARTFAPDRTGEGRIPGATSVVIWVLLAILLSIVGLAVIFAIASPGGSH